ncbi:MAG: patatin-like phospholipase family protein [Bacteroidales bacterium]|nr:patatin-like phospholipase family protein [Bacteroidales bacterium]MBN2698775.1 patatin-like phospholipase family protein [Bacteroidales bacterium]
MKISRYKSMLFLIVILCGPLCGQDTVSKRPVIGLVLSGGSARGLAHIGVLKVLESEGIYPDVITGTSMGGIIGGMYAIGYSPDEIDSILNTITWAELFNDKILLNRVAMTEKHDYGNNMLYMQFDRDHKPSFPLAIIQGQHITEKLGELTWHAAGIDNFDSLWVPYRTTAVDLVHSELHYFSGGDIKTAIRSTLAIPSIFGPVILDSMLFVDGGVMCSFPLEEAKRLGAEYTIGVYTSYNEKIKAGDIYSLIGVISRSAFITGVSNTRMQLEEVDLLIRPDLKNYGPESFAWGIEIMNIGEKAALNQIDTIKKLGAYLERFPEPQRKEIPRIDSFYVTRVGTEGNNLIKENYIIAWSGIKEGNWVKYRDVEKAITTIYSTLDFESVDYVLKRTDEGYALIFRVKEMKPGLLGLGAHYDNDFSTGIVVTALYRNLLFSADRIFAGVNISQNSQMRVDYNLYIGRKKRNFATLKFYAENSNLPHYFVIDTLSALNGKIRQSLWNAHISFGRMIGQNLAFSIKGNYEWSEYRFIEGLEEWYGIKRIREGAFRTRCAFNLNTMGRAYFPEEGIKFDATADFVTAGLDNYFKISGSYDHLVRLHRFFSAGVQARGGLITGPPLLYDRFYIGGDHFIPRTNMVSLMGWNVYELNTEDFISFGLTLQFNIKADFYLNCIGNMIYMNRATVSGDYASNNLYGFGISFGYRSIIGPIKLSVYSNSDEPGLNYFFNFSYPF